MRESRDLRPRPHRAQLEIGTFVPGRTVPSLRGRESRRIEGYVERMDHMLPGSSSAKSVGKAVLMAATRLVGGSDLAEAIAEVTGLSRMSVRRMAQKATESLNMQSTDEFRELGSREQTVWAESLLVEAFSRAAARDFQVAALMGPDDLLSLIIDDRVQAEL